ncbi:hypothetical protein INS49_001292 [Diaporthe citri]|uniref:uncharacterized protein n=1 Tax=Diaporthe citri TaxID=83186 RepID=UPI001C801ACA|nr:uncharacterized protein INS49_001292 [Diaporthe citri]KAG6367110.1 hypothetical protein INS49_001292 [Diaporthe citri]
MAAASAVFGPVQAYLPSVSSSSILMGLLLLLIARLFVVNVVYNLFLHPLSSYPGPKLWATSRLPWNYFNFRGRLGWRIRDLHNQYGPVVRIAPNELSYTTSSAWRKIYGQRSPEFEKAVDGRGIAPVEINGKRALMTETSEGHARLRKAINPAFSERAVRGQEKYLQAHSDTLLTQLLKSCKQGPADMAKWFNLLSYDSVVFFQFALQYGLISVLQFLTPKYAREARRKHLALSAAKVQARLQAKDPGKDFMHYILENQEEKFSSLDLTLLASTFIVAGSNTTSDTMTGLTYLLLRNPDKMACLKREIRSMFRSKDEITMQSTVHCRYLTACLEESMRLRPALCCSLARTVPDNGEIIDGQFVPGGTGVGVHMLAAAHSGLNFRHPMDFVPERWLELPPDSEFGGDDKGGSQPFSHGLRSCAGKALAWVEMRITMAKLLWHFDFELASPDEDWWNKQRTYLIWERLPLMINLRPSTA